MRWILSLLVLAWGHLAAAAEQEVTCTVTASRTSYQVGEVPELAFRIINQSTGDVVLVGSLDGSTDGRRYPRCVVEIVDASGKRLEGSFGFCGNMNPLSPSDFRLVPTGEAFDPFGEGFFPPPALAWFPIKDPGEYTFRFHYATSSRIQDYFGDDRWDKGYKGTPEIRRLFAQVPKVDLVSEITLTFTPKAE